MKIVRLKKGKNDFALANLTLGKLLAIQNALQACKDANALGPVGEDVLEFLDNYKNDFSEAGFDFGDTLFGKVTANSL